MSDKDVEIEMRLVHAYSFAKHLHIDLMNNWWPAQRRITWIYRAIALFSVGVALSSFSSSPLTMGGAIIGSVNLAIATWIIHKAETGWNLLCQQKSCFEEALHSMQMLRDFLPEDGPFNQLLKAEALLEQTEE